MKYLIDLDYDTKGNKIDPFITIFVFKDVAKVILQPEQVH